MGIGYRIFIYAAFLTGTLLFFISGLRSGDALTAAGSAIFLVAEVVALAYLEWLREERQQEHRRRRAEHPRERREPARER